MAKPKLRQFIRSNDATATRTMSVRISHDLYERLSKARKSAKALDVSIDVNQACAERIADLLDEYDGWYSEHKEADEEATTETPPANTSQTDLGSGNS